MDDDEPSVLKMSKRVREEKVRVRKEIESMEFASGLETL